MRFRFSACLLTVAVFACCSMVSAATRIMLLDGQSGGPYHPWRDTTPILKQQLEATGLFEVEVVTAPDTSGNIGAFQPDFKKYSAIVMNYDAPDWPAPLKASFEEYVKGGGGLVVVHAADNAFAGWPAFNQMIGIGGWRGRTESAGPAWYWKDGKLTADNTPGAAGRHGSRNPFLITTRDSNHPIMQGLPKTWMHAGDEVYNTMKGPGQNMTVLATAFSDPKDKGTGRDEPMLMVLSYGKGRIFHTTLGHDVPAMLCAGFLTTVQRGTEWAATGKVTQKVPADFPTADKVSLRTIPRAGKPLISAEALSAEVNDPNVVLLHVGTQQDYAAGHLPGSRLVTLADISITGDRKLSLEMPPVETLRAALLKLGIGDSSKVVIYSGNGSVQSATRVWFTFDYMSLPARLLDGGLAAWKEGGLPVSTEATVITPASALKLVPRPELIVDAAWVKAHLSDKSTAVIDARLPEFYSGQSAGQMPRAGHIPGAVNVPFSSIVTDKKEFLPEAQLADRLGQADTVVSYCHIGQQATVLYFAARMAGKQAKLYDGSFQDWSARPELPVDSTR